MTIQARDGVRYREQDYSLLGHNGPDLFDPEAYGLQPVPISSANRRGLTCGYIIRDNHLYLDHVNTRMYPDDSGVTNLPRLFGRAPKAESESDRLKRFGIHSEYAEDDLFFLSYTDLARPILLTGGLLLGKGYIENIALPRLSHLAFRCVEVHELHLTEGRIVATFDRSTLVAAIRERYLAQPISERDSAKVCEEIDRSFSLTYDYRL